MPTLVYRDAGVETNGLDKNAPSSITSGGVSFYLDGRSAVLLSRATLKFPIVPPGGTVVVSSAILTLTNADAMATTRGVELRKLLSPWVTAQTSWNNRATATPWNVAGVLTGADADSTVIATGTAPTAINASFNLTDVGGGFIQYVQDVLNGATDYGVIFNNVDEGDVFDSTPRRIRGIAAVTAAQRPTLTIEYTVVTPPNWTISSPTVDSDAGTVTLVVTLDAPAPSGGFNGFVNTYNITALAGLNYVAQVDAPFFIAEGGTTGNIVITLLP